MKTEEEILFGDTSSELLSLIDEFTPPELNEIPFHGSWTAGQVGDHLYRSYGIVHALNGNVVPATRPVDEKIPPIKVFMNDTIKMSPPEILQPSTGFIDKSALLEKLKERIAQLNDVIRHSDLSLICKDYAIPRFGLFTRLEWIYFTIYHTRRHLHQINRIKEIIIAKDFSGQKLSR